MAVANGKVHAGFFSAWDEISEDVLSALAVSRAQYPDFKLILTGHSLGGAVVTISAADIFPSASSSTALYTYGSPRAGNDVFADYVVNDGRAVYRVTHRDDPVPHLPTIDQGFYHVSPEFWLSGVVSTNQYTYPVDQIKVCRNESTKCNSGTLGLNVLSHLLYFGDMGPGSCHLSLRGGDNPLR